MPYQASKNVVAHAGCFVANSTHRCCAERNLIDKLVRIAHKKGVPRNSIVRFVRRKTKGHLVVQRYLHDETPACSVPCILCRKVLEFYDFHVTCYVCKDTVFCGKLTDPGSPPSTMTGAQRRLMFFRNSSMLSSSSRVGTADE